MGLKETNFFHIATKANTTGHITWLDDDRFRGRRDAVLMVTPRCGLAGTTLEPVFYPHHVSLVYAEALGVWGICNSDLSPMIRDSVFGVCVMQNLNTKATPHFYKHTATSRNIRHDATRLDYPGINGNPNAVLFITPATTSLFPKGQKQSTVDSTILDQPRWQTLSTSMLYAATREASDHPLGVRYDQSTASWSIVNNDSRPITPGMVFHVANWGFPAYPSQEHTSIEIVTSSGAPFYLLNYFRPDHRGNVHFISNNLSYDLYTGTNIEHKFRGSRPKSNLNPVATWWNAAENRIAIVGSDGTPLRRGLGFNVRHY